MLEKYLKEQFNISLNDKIKCNNYKKEYTVAQVIDIIQKKGTERNIVKTIKQLVKDGILPEKEDVFAYFEGMMEGLLL
ncbi:MAG: hypothetical protein K0Q97_946 [Bacillota bacterium]|jgi:hypothetical protein|nr:hypothetical protein [Bacillota bacterium]